MKIEEIRDELLAGLDDETLSGVITDAGSEVGVQLNDQQIQSLIGGIRTGIRKMFDDAQAEKALRMRLNGAMQRFYAGYGLRPPKTF